MRGFLYFLFWFMGIIDFGILMKMKVVGVVVVFGEVVCVDVWCEKKSSVRVVVIVNSVSRVGFMDLFIVFGVEKGVVVGFDDGLCGLL